MWTKFLNDYPLKSESSFIILCICALFLPPQSSASLKTIMPKHSWANNKGIMELVGGDLRHGKPFCWSFLEGESKYKRGK